MPYIQRALNELNVPFTLALIELIFASGSGLFFASKYPVLTAAFETFKCRKGWARCISYGVLCVKVCQLCNDSLYST